MEHFLPALSSRLRAWAEKVGPEAVEIEKARNDPHLFDFFTESDAAAIKRAIAERAERQAGLKAPETGRQDDEIAIHFQKAFRRHRAWWKSPLWEKRLGIFLDLGIAALVSGITALAIYYYMG